jgi:hypothetical protein
VEGKGFVEARRLARSDLLRNARGESVAVEQVSIRAWRGTVYNFEVANTHTYFANGRWVHNTCPQEILNKLRAPGKYEGAIASSKEEALEWAREAFPNAMELPEAVAGQPYPKAPPGVKDWFQVQPPEPAVGNMRPHVKYEIWSGGKKTSGGSWGHIWY